MARALETLGFVVALLVLGFAINWYRDGDGIVSVSGDDAEMNAAISRAVETLPVFWKAYDKPAPNQETFLLKVRISDENGIEHVWLSEIRRGGDDMVIEGTVANEPRDVKSIRQGDRYSFKQEDVTDWAYTQSDKIHGGYTLRVMVERMSEDEAAGLKASLAYRPE